ncbi:MAG: polysaccharide ABC transporter ATP-binding protein [Armatimonadota bacterium]|nr:polysaccharide ABC transporter ATP-binding protein [bacterium]
MKVISAENVSKRFVLSHARSRNLADAARGFLRRTPRDDFWALKDVCFDVEQGEALGIIGHNGAGKSTMLKLLTKIMKPTQGRIRTRGRISALIEVGAGFHPEMTGRENIYLNGSILGMTRREIDSKFDEIVSFAELERFIDTPVKRYSSGMYARLGFSVAAHVKPDILVVDEVLSVGDALFQNRCAVRMRQIKENGATIVFVSHNLNAVTDICDRAIGLSHGEVFVDDIPSKAIGKYRELISNETPIPPGLTCSELGADDSPFIITSVESSSPSREEWSAYMDEDWTIRINYAAKEVIHEPEIIVSIKNSDGLSVFQPCNIDYGAARDVSGSGTIEFRAEKLSLLPGRYSVEVLAWPYDCGRHWYDLLVRPSRSNIVGPGIRYGVAKIQGQWVWLDNT